MWIDNESTATLDSIVEKEEKLRNYVFELEFIAITKASIWTLYRSHLVRRSLETTVLAWTFQIMQIFTFAVDVVNWFKMIHDRRWADLISKPRWNAHLKSCKEVIDLCSNESWFGMFCCGRNADASQSFFPQLNFNRFIIFYFHKRTNNFQARCKNWIYWSILSRKVKVLFSAGESWTSRRG